MFFQCVKSVTNRDGTPTQIVMIHSLRIIATVCLTFINVLILICFERWKQFNYLLYKKHMDWKKLLKSISLITRFPGFVLQYVLFQDVSQIVRCMTNRSATGTRVLNVSHGSVQSGRRRSKSYIIEQEYKVQFSAWEFGLTKQFKWFWEGNALTSHRGLDA